MKNKKCWVLFLTAFILTVVLVGCKNKGKSEEHSFSEWEIVEDATCTKDGLKKRNCSDCNDEETEVIPMLGHNYVDNRCQNCGATIGTTGLEYVFNEIKDGYEVKGILNSTVTDIVIPNTYQEYPVVGILRDAFKGNTNLKSIYIPSTIKTISSEAFMDCKDLVNVTFEENSQLTVLNDRLFENCISLKSVKIPNSIVGIGKYVFTNCSAEILWDNPSLKKIGTYAFYMYLGETVKLPETIISIDECAFKSSSISHIKIPKGVKILEEEAFSFCYVLEEVLFEDDSQLNIIESSVFYSNQSLNNLSLPEGLKSIDVYAFYGCSSLESITIPSEISRINSYTFYGCGKLKEVIFSEDSKLTNINNYAFTNCSSLQSITITEGVTSIGNYAFSSCYKLVEIYNLSSINITLGDSTNGNVGYNAKVIHDSLDDESIIKVTEDGYEYIYVDEIYYLFGYNGKEKDLVFPKTINDSVYDIYKCAFYNNLDIYSVVIPEGVTTIKERAFMSCYNLNSIVIPSTIQSIESSSFDYCYKLYEIYNLSSNLNIYEGSSSYGYIGYYAKVVHNSLDDESILIDAENGYKFMYLDEKYYLIAYTGEENNLSLPEIIDGSSYDIYDYAFYYNKDITSVVIPEGVEEVGEKAFTGCIKIEDIIVPGSVTTFGWWYSLNLSPRVNFNEYEYGLYLGDDKNPYHVLVTAKLEELGSVTIKNDTKVLAEAAFYRFYNISSITIPSSVEYIGGFAFSECRLLEEVIFEDEASIKSIGRKAFYYCYSLKSITIPKSVISIDKEAFMYCYKLVDVYNLSSLEIELGSDQNGYAGYYAKEIHDSLDDESIIKVTEDGYEYIYVDEKYYLIGYTGNEIDLVLPEKINDSTYDIYKCAFYYREDIHSVVITKEVMVIGNDAFEGCTNIVSITLPETLTLISSGAFDRCSKIVSMVIPKSVVEIQNYAFYDWVSTTKIYYNGTKEEWANVTIGIHNTVLNKIQFLG